jgi:integrase/recombinase XerD
MKMRIDSVLDIKDNAIITSFAKTGIRRDELVTIDLDDLNWIAQSITLKPKRKRSIRVVFFDDETARIRKRWIRLRERREPKPLLCSSGSRGGDQKGLAFISPSHSMHSECVSIILIQIRGKITFPRTAVGTGSLRISKEQEWNESSYRSLGDKRRDASDIEEYTDEEELREVYLAHILQRGA